MVTLLSPAVQCEVVASLLVSGTLEAQGPPAVEWAYVPPGLAPQCPVWGRRPFLFRGELLMLLGVYWGRPVAASASWAAAAVWALLGWWREQPLCRCRPTWGKRTEGHVFQVKVESPLLAATAVVT